MSEHIHDHEHNHDHDHGHEHNHEHGHEVTTAALLQYMVEHNRSHLEELRELAQDVHGEAAEKLSAAMEAFGAGNDKLAEALKLFKEE